MGQGPDQAVPRIVRLAADKAGASGKMGSGTRLIDRVVS